VQKVTEKPKANSGILISVVTFKDLQKLAQSQSNSEQTELLKRLKDKPFWIWNQEEHRQIDLKIKGDCCFNHIIGLQ
jgi:hypothetical protein